MVRVAVAPHRTGRAGEDRGDVGQVMLMQANLRMPASVDRGGRGQRRRGQCRRHPLPARPPDAIRRSMPTGAQASPRPAAPPASQRLVHISGIGADNRSSTNAYLKSKVAAEDAVIAGFTSATILRPSVVFGPGDALFTRLAAHRRDGAVPAADRRRLGQGPAGLRRAMSAAPSWPCWQRPETAQHACSSWAARASTPIARSPRWCCARSTARSRSSACRRR